MVTDDFIKDIRKKICAEVDLAAEGIDRYVVHTPFTFDDGDHFVVYLKRVGGEWVLTDEGHTLMHLSYSGLDLTQGRRGKILDESLAYHGIDNIDGELRLSFSEERAGDALFSYLQGLSKATSVTQITKEVARTTFFDDFRGLIEELVPNGKYSFDWTDPEFDSKGSYVVDCRIDGARPWLIFAVNSDYKCSQAMIICLMLEKRLGTFGSVAIFDDQTKINRKPLAQLSDVIGKQFSTLDDKNRIKRYFADEILLDA